MAKFREESNFQSNSQHDDNFVGFTFTLYITIIKILHGTKITMKSLSLFH